MSRSEPNSNVAARHPARYQAIEERDASGLSYEEFLGSYVRGSRAVIVRKATPAWPALQKWTPEFFKSAFPDRLVQISYDETMRFADFIDGVLASTIEKPGPYMYRLFLHEHLPEVLPDLSPQNPYAFPRRYSSPLMMEYWRRPDGYLKLLIGGVGGRFPIMHYDGDNAHATITEVYGDKEFIVYPPSDSPYLYPSPKRANHSLVDDPHLQDLQRFPLLERATQYRSILHPGDMVFVPCGWWHTARALSPSISVGMNILDESNWRGFVSEVCGPVTQSLALKPLLKRAYFEGLGPFFSGLERIQRDFPRAARTLVLPALLAPHKSELTHDPSTRRLHIRVPTG
ncbi:MAG TPA: cupin-like domain-containing protein [Polyangiaceae bacterium]|nr:cupin-like domain-containing protein [Polyangiaceae bacterium]